MIVPPGRFDCPSFILCSLSVAFFSESQITESLCSISIAATSPLLLRIHPHLGLASLLSSSWSLYAGSRPACHQAPARLIPSIMSKETTFFFRQYDLAAFLISTFPCSCVFRTHHGYVPTGRHTLFSQAPLAAYIKYKKPKNIFSMLLGSLFSATFIFTLSIHFYAVKSSLWYLKRLNSKIYGAAENFSTSFFEIKPDCT